VSLASSTQPLDTSARVLIAQAKQLELNLRHEFQNLVDTFNVGIDHYVKRRNNNSNSNNTNNTSSNNNNSVHNTTNKSNNNNNNKNTQVANEEKNQGEDEGAVVNPNKPETKTEEEEQQEAGSALLVELIKGSSLRLSSGLRAQAKFGPVKSLVRLQQKGDPVRVLDYARTSLVFADPLLLGVFFEEFRKREKFKILRVQNKFTLARPLTEPPNVHINFEFGGHVCELQLTLEDFALIKDYSHKPYEIVRIAKTKLGELKNSDKLREAVEDLIAEGVYYPHPGTGCYPSPQLPLAWH